jgi:GTP diphosphokinase / guanosine-3',5'-bis(diphosphate) 3'-diphosphatase
MREDFAKLAKSLRKTFSDEDVALVRRAYSRASEAHQGVKRLSGEQYISHTIATARILQQIGMDPTTIAAALLHDVLEDTSVTYDDLAEEFGEEIASLVDGVSKIKHIEWAASAEGQIEKQAENLRKMLVATAQDVRVVIIKLADRLHNMRTVEFIRDPRRVERICRETIDIYAPIARRLGIAAWQWELEDHAFHFLHPIEYKELARRLAMKRKEREDMLNETITMLEKRLEEAEVSARVIGRPKHLYSIYRKMVTQGKDFDQVLDVLAVRIITQTISGAYNALGVCHQLWTPVPGRVKDYVAMPKLNMYQSIHTTVMHSHGQPLEIQIRTEEMDHTARDGISAHWRYKEGRSDSKLDLQLGWLQQMYDWMQDAHAPDELLDSLQRDIGVRDVYVFTPRGKVLEFPTGATPLDFAYRVHSDVGHQCLGARVNGRAVPLRYHLQNGDVVEILTSKTQRPQPEWLDIVVTGRARTRIRQRLREIGEMEPLDGQIRRHTAESAPVVPASGLSSDPSVRDRAIRVPAANGHSILFAKCCKPTIGQPVIAYRSRGATITVHRADCRNFSSVRRDPSRLMAAHWEGEQAAEVCMRVVLGQRPNVLADLTAAIRPMNVNILSAKFDTDERGQSVFDFEFEALDDTLADRLAATLRTVTGVRRVEQLKATAVAEAVN